MFGIIGSDDWERDLRGTIIGTSASMIVLAGLAVGFRFLGRWLVRQPAGWDDWLSLAALPFVWAVSILPLAMVKASRFGVYFLKLNNEETATYFMLVLPYELCWVLAVALPKLSMLAFYRRVFSTPRTKIPAYALGALIILFIIASLPMFIFSCNPIRKFWYLMTPGTCQPVLHQFLGTAIPNTVFDIALFIFPIPLITALQLPRSYKIAVFCIFTIAGFIIVIDGLRMVTIVQVMTSMDPTWALVPLGIFGSIQASIGLVCACLPSMTPVFRAVASRKLNLRTSPLPSLSSTIQNSPPVSDKMSVVSDEVCYPIPVHDPENQIEQSGIVRPSSGTQRSPAEQTVSTDDTHVEARSHVTSVVASQVELPTPIEGPMRNQLRNAYAPKELDVTTQQEPENRNSHVSRTSISRTSRVSTAESHKPLPTVPSSYKGLNWEPGSI